MRTAGRIMSGLVATGTVLVLAAAADAQDRRGRGDRATRGDSIVDVQTRPRERATRADRPRDSRADRDARPRDNRADRDARPRDDRRDRDARGGDDRGDRRGRDNRGDRDARSPDTRGDWRAPDNRGPDTRGRDGRNDRDARGPDTRSDWRAPDTRGRDTRGHDGRNDWRGRDRRDDRSRDTRSGWRNSRGDDHSRYRRHRDNVYFGYNSYGGLTFGYSNHTRWRPYHHAYRPYYRSSYRPYYRNHWNAGYYNYYRPICWRVTERSWWGGRPALVSFKTCRSGYGHTYRVAGSAYFVSWLHAGYGYNAYYRW